MLFCAMRAADCLNVFVGLWLVPKYVPPSELGAVQPLKKFKASSVIAVLSAPLRHRLRLLHRLSARVLDRLPRDAQRHLALHLTLVDDRLCRPQGPRLRHRHAPPKTRLRSETRCAITPSCRRPLTGSQHPHLDEMQPVVKRRRTEPDGKLNQPSLKRPAKT